MTPTQAERRLIVAWRDPETHAISPVGMLTVSHTASGAIRFRYFYVKAALDLPSFRPFASFPHLYRIYEADRLFPLFENRVMPQDRPGYRSYLEQLDLMPDVEPFIVLARSGGRRATDRVEVLPVPERDASGRLVSQFFARGIGHIDDAEEAVARLSRGASLSLVAETDNPYNSRALLLHNAENRPVGYVPDLLVDFVHDVLNLCQHVEIDVVRVNSPEVPLHMRLLCRIISCEPPDYKPFAGESYTSLTDVFTTARRRTIA